MVIRMRHTRAHTRNRRSHHALKESAIAVCGHCKAAVRPHHMCLSCGYYNGRQVLDLASAKIKRDARIKAKHDRIKLETGPGTAAPQEVATEKVTTAEVAEKTVRKTTRVRKVSGGAVSAKAKEEN